ncbi:MAG: winged helix-turn-helix domain-containing protein [Dehalococcoidales bacterium]|nr:winged helix-turn-helix domain-containing protein [Dehalococcoidales bacterium]
MAEWNLFTSHGLILVTIAKNPDMTAREISNDIGLTERTTHKIIIDLEDIGYINRVKVGRQNKYRIHSTVPIQDEVTNTSIGELLATLGWKRHGRRPKNTKVKNL